jgi:hypothetical protein
MIGLALGPYTAGKISTLTGDLGFGLLSLLVVVPFLIIALALVYVDLDSEHRARSPA